MCEKQEIELVEKLCKIAKTDFRTSRRAGDL